MKKLQFLKAGDYMKTITRAKYLDRIIELNGTPDIKIITGIRRSGKSKLMQAYIAYLKSNFENINIIFIDFMDLAYEEIKEYHALHAYVEEHYQEGKTNYLFVDEVQMCPKFELAINSLYSKGKYDIYVTGSNAFLLSADLATLFTGRYIEIHVFPFSFQEYCQYYDDISDKDKLFDEYAIKGGLAGSYAYRTEKDRTNYIKEVYETIVTRDLVQKYTLPDTLVLGHFPFCVKGDNEVLQVYITFRIAAHDTANGDIHILQQGIGSLQTGCRVMISGNDDNLHRRVLGRNFS